MKETFVVENLGSDSEETFLQWIDTHDLGDSTYVITGVTNDDVMVRVPDQFTPQSTLEIPLATTPAPLHTYEYLLMEYVYVGEGFTGPRFAWRFTATDDRRVAEIFFQRWEESLDFDDFENFGDLDED